MINDLNCTEYQATIGLSVYTLGFAIVPLLTASFSEEFGRQPLYAVSVTGFTLMHMMIALSQNIQTVIIARFLQGAFGSTGATMVGGTIADIWSSEKRGLPMSIFALASLGGTGVGPTMAGYIEMNSHLRWRWIQWVQMIICAVYLIAFPVVLKETRSSIILTRIAKNMRKETGDVRYRAQIEDERPSLRSLVYISCTRPIYLMVLEPIIISISLWIGLAWGIIYCLIESIGGAFSTLHGFSNGDVGLTFLTMAIGSLIGFFTNIHQDRLYKKYCPTRGPEARLHYACVGAVLLPASMFLYAWSSFPRVHWIVPMIGIILFSWGTYIIFLAVCSYLADCYGTYASSALAGQGLARNLMGAVFPLFTTKMFQNLGYNWANTIFALIAVVMMPIPFVLYFYGPAIRKRSKFSSKITEMQGY